MKILLSLFVLTGLTSCAHKSFCPGTESAVSYSDNMESAATTAMNSELSDELSSSQAAPVLSAATPVNLNSATIKQIQAKLNLLGMKSGPVDGIKGPMTTSALKRFQTSEKLWVDGGVDSNTLNALNITEEKNKL